MKPSANSGCSRLRERGRTAHPQPQHSLAQLMGLQDLDLEITRRVRDAEGGRVSRERAGLRGHIHLHSWRAGAKKEKEVHRVAYEPE